MSSFLHSLKTKISSTPLLERALHTVWQACLGYLLATHTVPHSSQDVTTLLTGIYGAALSALKTMFIQYRENRG